MTLTEAKALAQGQVVYHPTKRNADGTAMRAKVLSVKTWKRNPERVLVSVKHGMYDYAKFNEWQLEELCVTSPTAGTINAKGKLMTE